MKSQDIYFSKIPNAKSLDDIFYGVLFSFAPVPAFVTNYRRDPTASQKILVKAFLEDLQKIKNCNYTDITNRKQMVHDIKINLDIFNKQTNVFDLVNNPEIRKIYVELPSVSQQLYLKNRNVVISAINDLIEYLNDNSVDVEEKESKKQLNGTEKILAIMLLQEIGVFTQLNQKSTNKSIDNLIAAITGISSGNDVKKKRITLKVFFNRDPITKMQICEKIKNFENVKPLLTDLNIPILEQKLKAIETKLNNNKNKI